MDKLNKIAQVFNISVEDMLESSNTLISTIGKPITSSGLKRFRKVKA